MILRFIIFLSINMAALVIGGLFTSKGVPSEWYIELNKAPWTPPGWMFGFAWTTIMVCFAGYLAFLWPEAVDNRTLTGIFTVQWILNVMWNPIFFYFNKILIALIVIILLTFVVGYFLFTYWPVMKMKSLLILPYFIWLLLATSLNGYVVMAN